MGSFHSFNALVKDELFFFFHVGSLLHLFLKIYCIYGGSDYYIYDLNFITFTVINLLHLWFLEHFLWVIHRELTITISYKFNRLSVSGIIALLNQT